MNGVEAENLAQSIMRQYPEMRAEAIYSMRGDYALLVTRERYGMALRVIIKSEEDFNLFADTVSLAPRPRDPEQTQ